MTDSAQSKRRYHYRKNQYGGWEVVDSNGKKAPRPHSFNQEQRAADRAATLNREGS